MTEPVAQASAQPGPPAGSLDVSIVMPCLNEEESVADCVRKALGWIAQSGLTGEVIIVDNGSSDRSAEIAAAAGARVIHEPVRGYGSAIRRGFRDAYGKYLVMGDCDGTYEFGELDPLVRPLVEGSSQMVMGNRLTDRLAPGAMPWAHRFIGTPFISWVLRLFTGATITDSQCGLRAIRKDAVDQLDLRSPGMEFASEMILKATRKGVQITEVDIPYDVRTGESKLSTFRDGWRHLRFLMLSSPSYIFLVPGFILLLLGLFSLGVMIFDASGIQIGSLDWAPVFAAGIFFVIGINVLMLGLLSKLLAFRVGAVESRLVRFYHNYLGLERLLVLSLATLAVGAAVDAFVLIERLGDSDRDLLPWAAVGQVFLVMGANLLFGALAAAMVDHETAAS